MPSRRKRETALDHITLTKEDREDLKAAAEITEADVEALQRALHMTLNEWDDPARIRQVREMLTERSWFTVAEFCSYHQQNKNLQTKPWESPPCWIGTGATIEPEYLEIGRRLQQAGLSLFEPDPLRALEDAKRNLTHVATIA
jgi:hypothetical protein